MKRFSISITHIAFILLSLLQCATRVHAHNGVFEMKPIVNSLSAAAKESASSEVSSSSPSVSQTSIPTPLETSVPTSLQTSAPTPLPTVAKTSAPTASPVTPPAPAPPKPAPAPDSDIGSNTSKVILSYAILFTWIVAVSFFFVALRVEIKMLFMTCLENYRENGVTGCLSCFRGSNSRRTGLNDIVFDPEDEQRASLSESLLATD